MEEILDSPTPQETYKRGAEIETNKPGANDNLMSPESTNRVVKNQKL
jgi:hypothetical protein